MEKTQKMEKKGGFYYYRVIKNTKNGEKYEGL